MIRTKRLLTPLIFMVMGSLLVFCSPEKKKKSTNVEKKDSVKNGLVTTLFDNGKVRVEINYVDGLKQGVAKEYYKEGGLFQEINYNKGIKEGQAKRYHTNGKLYQQTDYVAGKIQGKQLKFRDTGKPASEAIFFQNEPCSGLIEYTLKGTVKKKYPSIVITPVDNLLLENKYTIRLSMSDKTRNVEFYLGKLDAKGCLGSDVKRLWLEREDGIVELDYHLPPGAFIMESLNIIARVKTIQGNYFFTQRSYNVAAENK